MRGRYVFMLALLSCIAVAPATTRAQSGKPLTIYVVDVEGGNATLFVAPSGQSLLIDTGNGGPAAERDGGRILAAAKDAGLTQIDHLITTHWHGDHFGAMEIRRIEAADQALHRPRRHRGGARARQCVCPRGLSRALREGDAHRREAGRQDRHRRPRLADCRGCRPAHHDSAAGVASAGKPNRTCADYKAGMPDPTENAQSVGSIVTFGKFRVAHLGDLTWNKEYELMCPNNPIGTVDLFIVSHHGQAISNSPQLVHALHPRVMVMNNGTRKGGQPDAMKVLHTSPGLEDLWQVHFSQLSGQEYTVPGMFIANTVDEPIAAMPDCRSHGSARARARHRRRHTTARLTGSRSPRGTMDRSP